jgi:RNA polymerase sigma-70 factor, ECF subfamily
MNPEPISGPATLLPRLRRKLRSTHGLRLAPQTLAGPTALSRPSPARPAEECVAPAFPPNLPADQVVRDYGGRIYAIARRMLTNDSDAEDVTQDVLLQVVRKLGDFRGESSVATWLHRVTVNAALKRRRARAHSRERQVYGPPERFAGVCERHGRARPSLAAGDDELLTAELRHIIGAAMDTLPARYRDVYDLGEVEGFSNAEIGEWLGLSLAAVKSRLHRARRLMREALARYVDPT